MGSDVAVEPHWKWVALAALTGCVLLATALAYTFRLLARPAPQVDDRLVGTWQSDADRTVAEWQERRPITDEGAESLRREIFGHLRVTFTGGDRTEEFQGRVTTAPYAVLGRDDTSVVIRAQNPDSRADELIHIHFVGAEMFWVHAQMAPLREYFRRVK